MRSDRQDAALWTLLSAALLASIPIGFVSGDGIAHVAEFTAGTWKWNPNHLLFEPAGAAWLALLRALGVSRSGPDLLKLESIAAGAIAAGLFRLLLAGRIAARRAAANHATAWFALGSAFSRLWISDETHMIQMPFLTAAAAAALALIDRPGRGRAFLLGAAIGVSSLAFISNAPLGCVLLAAVFLRLARDRGPRTAAVSTGAAAAAAAVTLLAPLGAAWARTAPAGTGFLHWLASYGGGAAGRATSTQGIGVSLSSLAVSSARALYGSASAVVDLAPAVDAYRDGGVLSPGVLLPLAAFGAAAAALGAGLLALARERRSRRGRDALLIVVVWIVSVVGFGIAWNNSDDQFYFQLAIPIGLIAAFIPGDRVGGAAVALSVAGLLWNAGEGTVRRVLYPREELVTILGDAVAGGGLVIYPGNDEAARILSFVPLAPGSRRLAIADLAGRVPPAEGLARLDAAVREAAAGGARVDVVSVFDVPAGRLPWKYLGALGYDQTHVRGVLARYPVETSSRRAGPFTIRSIPPG